MNQATKFFGVFVISLALAFNPTSANASSYNANSNSLSFNKSVIAIADINDNSGTITITTATPHRLVVSDVVSISGVNPSAYNLSGKTVLAVVNATKFEIQDAATGFYVSGGLVEILQADGVGSDANTFGRGMAVNQYVDFVNVYTSGGTQINARLTLKRTQDLETNTSIADRSSSTAGNNAFALPQINPDAGNGVSYAEWEIKFFTGLNLSSPTFVTLENFSVSVYDIDDYQFVEFAGWSSYSRASNTILSIAAAEVLQNPPGKKARFVETNGQGTSGNASFVQGRVTLQYDSAQTLVFVIGQNATNAPSPETGTANYSIDFSVGWDVGGDWTSARTNVTAEPGAAAPRSVPYEGPLNLRNQSGALCSNGEGVLTGERLNTITEIYVGDKKVAQELTADGRLKYSLKDIAPGTYQIRYWVPVNSLNLTDQIRVGTCSTAPVATAPGTFEASRLFANYRGDRGPVIARDRAAITAFINQYKGITSVKCVGSTSGVPAKSTDPALATARAQNACDIVKTLVPNATYTLETSTGKGVGQRFRSVTIFISGTN